jgi:hypothetical protein
MISEREMGEQTMGELLVRTQFNPSGEGIVYDLKRYTAAIIDLVDKIPQVGPQSGRLKALAITAYEEAAMWAVKAATVEPQK